MKKSKSFIVPKCQAITSGFPSYFELLRLQTAIRAERRLKCGSAVVSKFGRLRDELLLSLSGFESVHFFIAVNFVDTDSDDILDRLYERLLIAIQNGTRVSVVFELLSPRSNFELLQRVAAIPGYGGQIFRPSLDDHIYEFCGVRFAGPHPVQLRFSYQAACNHRIETIKKCVHIFTMLKKEAMSCAIQFVDRADRPLVYSLKDENELLVEGAYSAGLSDVEHHGFYSDDELAIRSCEISRLSTIHSGRSASKLIEDSMNPAVLSNSKIEFDTRFFFS